MVLKGAKWRYSILVIPYTPYREYLIIFQKVQIQSSWCTPGKLVYCVHKLSTTLLVCWVAMLFEHSISSVWYGASLTVLQTTTGLVDDGLHLHDYVVNIWGDFNSSQVLKDTGNSIGKVFCCAYLLLSWVAFRQLRRIIVGRYSYSSLYLFKLSFIGELRTLQIRECSE